MSYLPDVLWSEAEMATPSLHSSPLLHDCGSLVLSMDLRVSYRGALFSSRIFPTPEIELGLHILCRVIIPGA